MGWVFMVVGLFPVVCSVLDVPWFFEHRKARPLVLLVGRPGARVFYALLGLALMGLGAAGVAGVIELSR